MSLFKKKKHQAIMMQYVFWDPAPSPPPPPPPKKKNKNKNKKKTTTKNKTKKNKQINLMFPVLGPLKI